MAQAVSRTTMEASLLALFREELRSAEALRERLTGNEAASYHEKLGDALALIQEAAGSGDLRRGLRRLILLRLLQGLVRERLHQRAAGRKKWIERQAASWPEAQSHLRALAAEEPELFDLLIRHWA